MSLLAEAITNSALSKLKTHMVKEGISCYLASLTDEGEFTTTPIKGEFKIVPMKEYLELKSLLTQKILHNGK